MAFISTRSRPASLARFRATMVEMTSCDLDDEDSPSPPSPESVTSLT